MLKKILFFILLIITTKAFSQKETRIELIGANSFEFDKQRGEDVRRLIGDVVFKHDNYYMYCDSAYLYNLQNSLEAFGKVRIRSGDTLNLYGSYLKYNGNTKEAILNKDVLLKDRKMTLTTNHLNYNLNTDIASYVTNGKLEETNNTLTSRKGYYYAKTKKFFFKEKVNLKNPQYEMNSDTLMYNTGNETANFFGPTLITSKNNSIYCERGYYNTKTDISEFYKNVHIIDSAENIKADSVYYNRKTGVSKANGNVIIVSKDSSTIIKSRKAFYDEQMGYILITSKPKMILAEKDDSLYMYSDTIKAISTDSTGKNKIIYAFHNMRFYKKDLQGRADTMIYNTKDSLIFLRHNPILWSDKNQLTAESVRIEMENKKIRKAIFNNSSFIISRHDTSKYNQIKAKDMTAWFTDGKLAKMQVRNNSQTIYFMKDEDESLLGINLSSSPDMDIYIKDNKISKVVHLEPTEGSFNPEKNMKQEDLLLKDFLWLEKQKPVKE